MEVDGEMLVELIFVRSHELLVGFRGLVPVNHHRGYGGFSKHGTSKIGGFLLSMADIG